jgi:hypothetical protein
MHNKRRSIPLLSMVVVLIAVPIICGLSYLANPYCGKLAESSQIDLLAGNLCENWSVFGALSATQVTFKRINDGSVEVKIRGDSQSWSSESSGVSYKVGLYYSSWYEFSGEVKADANPLKGTGAQLEVRSDRWRVVLSAGQPARDGWKRIDVYFRPSYSEPGADISCRFWGGTGDPAERALFRNMRIVRIDGAPPPTALQFDLAKKEKARLGKPRRQRNPTFRSVELTVLLLVTIIGASWRLLA